MKKRILKAFIAITGLILGFNIPVVAQYGAPESIYLRKKMLEQEKRFVIKNDTQKCNSNYIRFDQANIIDTNTHFLLENDLNTPNSPPSDLTPELVVYPNPCTANALIKLKNPVGKFWVLHLYNIDGQLITEWICTENELIKDIQFSMEGFSKGIYLLTAEYDSQPIFTEKIIKF